MTEVGTDQGASGPPAPSGVGELQRTGLSPAVSARRLSGGRARRRGGPGRRAVPPSRLRRTLGIARRFALPVLIIVFWQVQASRHALDTTLFSSPGQIVTTLWQMARNGTLWSNLEPSFERAATGLAIGVAAGTVFGLACGLWTLAEEVFDSTIQMLRTVPFVALTSLFVVWFGFGELPKVLLIAYACFIPMYRKLVEMSRSLGVDTYTTIRHILLPGSLPSALVGLRYAISISVLALVIAETINTTRGLGYLLIEAQTYFETPVIFIVIVIYCLMGIFGDGVVRLLEWRFLSYRIGIKGR